MKSSRNFANSTPYDDLNGNFVNLMIKTVKSTKIIKNRDMTICWSPEKRKGMRRRRNFDDLHENLSQSIEALYYSKGKKSAPQAIFFDDLHKNILERLMTIPYPMGG